MSDVKKSMAPWVIAGVVAIGAIGAIANRANEDKPARSPVAAAVEPYAVTLQRWALAHTDEVTTAMTTMGDVASAVGDAAGIGDDATVVSYCRYGADEGTRILGGAAARDRDAPADYVTAVSEFTAAFEACARGDYESSAAHAIRASNATDRLSADIVAIRP